MLIVMQLTSLILWILATSLCEDRSIVRPCSATSRLVHVQYYVLVYSIYIYMYPDDLLSTTKHNEKLFIDTTLKIMICYKLIRELLS